jgi:hypothetical protein
MRSGLNKILYIVRWPFAAVFLIAILPIFCVPALTIASTDPLEDWWDLVKEELFEWDKVRGSFY